MSMVRIMLALLFLYPALASAAVVPVPRISVALGASPSYQRPYESVLIRASASVPRGTYTYRWETNGTDAGEGIDRDTLRVVAGGAGSKTVVTVTLIDGSGSVVGEAEYTIQPADIDILWEGETYVPPFYDGRRLVTSGGLIRIEALPEFIVNGKSVEKGDLIYTWNTDGTELKNQSGYGRYALRIGTTRFKNATTVTVTAQTADGTVAAKKTAVIAHVTPRVVVYEERALAGTAMNRATGGTVTFEGDEMTFRAVPFFTSVPQLLTFTWLLDNKPLEVAGDDASIATFRRTGSGDGTARIAVTAEKEGSLFEKASAVFNLSFN